MRRVFVRFLEEIEVTKKSFRNYLTIIADLEAQAKFSNVLKEITSASHDKKDKKNQVFRNRLKNSSLHPNTLNFFTIAKY